MEYKYTDIEGPLPTEGPTQKVSTIEYKYKGRTADGRKGHLKLYQALSISIKSALPTEGPAERVSNIDGINA